MKERPILFQGAMVRALLKGSKTQTRRFVKPQHLKFFNQSAGDMLGQWDKRPLPYGEVGDRLWVKETYWRDDEDGGILYAANPDDFEIVQQNKHETGSPRYNWKPSIFMPRWASRVTLEITGVRVERLQDISESDAIAEGCTENHNGYYWGGPHEVSGLKQMATAKGAYRDLWQSINGPESWDENPWVWVVEFKVIKPC